jgi:hypothetical protein
MTPQRGGLGALAGAAEAGIGCCRGRPDITCSDIRPPPVDGLRRYVERTCPVIDAISEGGKVHVVNRRAATPAFFMSLAIGAAT